MKVTEYDDNEENDDDPRTPERQKIYELFYAKKDGGQVMSSVMICMLMSVNSMLNGMKNQKEIVKR